MQRHSLLLGVVFFAFAGCGSETPPSQPARSLTIYVAASTKEAVEEIAKTFQAETGVRVEVSPGPSSRLAKQIVGGGPADLFLSADQANADYLEEKQLVAKRRNLLANRLVVVTPADSQLKLSKLGDLAEKTIKQLALAMEKVPAGEYAREALGKAGVWEQVKDKVIGGDDVRATLAFVERGADAGIVYKTDALGSSKVRIAFEIDPALHKPIEYPLVLIRREADHEAAEEFYQYLASEQVAEAFRRAQFVVLK
jgi:molybdate transport system substrate-binding protein